MRLNGTRGSRDRLLFAAAAIFLFSCTFSGSAGSLAGGLAAVLFVVLAFGTGNALYFSQLKWIYLGIGSFVGWMVTTALINGLTIESLKALRHEWLFALVPVAVYLLQDEKKIRSLIVSLLCGVGGISIYAIGQFFWGWNFLKPYYQLEQSAYGYWIVGNFSSSVTFGIFYAVAGIFLLGYWLASAGSKPDRITKLSLIAGGLATAASVLSGERGPTVAVIVSLIALSLFLRSRKALLTLVIALSIVGLVGGRSGVFARTAELYTKEMSLLHDQGRRFIWTYSFYVACEHPLAGVGPGNFRQGYAAEIPKDPPVFTSQGHAHNDILNYAAQSGFLEALLYLAVWGGVLWCSWRGYTSLLITETDRQLAFAGLAGSLCFFITSQFDIPFGHSTTRQLLMFIWGAGLSVYVKSRPPGVSTRL